MTTKKDEKDVKPPIPDRDRKPGAETPNEVDPPASLDTDQIEHYDGDRERARQQGQPLVVNPAAAQPPAPGESKDEQLAKVDAATEAAQAESKDSNADADKDDDGDTKPGKTKKK